MLQVMHYAPKFSKVVAEARMKIKHIRIKEAVNQETTCVVETPCRALITKRIIDTVELLGSR